MIITPACINKKEINLIERCSLLIIFLLVFLFWPTHSTAQVGETGLADGRIRTNISEEVFRIREDQLRLARQDNAVLQITDSSARSMTRINQLPDILRNMTINNELDAESAVRNLYPYFGFTGTESLELERETYTAFEEVYVFRQYIADLRTDYFISVYVSKEDWQIERILGNTIIDREYDRTPGLDEEVAISAAIRLARQKEEDYGRGPIYRLDRNQIYTEIEYRSWGENYQLEAVWAVYLPVRNPSNPDFTHERYRVNPSGEAVDPEVVTHSNR